MTHSEAAIERRFVNLLTRWGFERGIKLLCHKYEVPGHRGYPDRMIMAEGAFVMFIEFKFPGYYPGELQLRRHATLRKMGFIVEVHDDADEALASATGHILATLPPSAGYADGGAGVGVPDLPQAG